MKATADLREEHGGVARMLAIMDRIEGRAHSGEAPNADELAQVIDFLRVFVDKCHHGKEEMVLFPAMRDSHIATAEGVIDELLLDHTAGRSAVVAISQAADSVASGDEGALRALADSFAAYTALLRAHIRREERDCFDVADRELSAEAAERLQEGFDRIEREVVGGGVHEAFHELLDRLSFEYGPHRRD
ncbi:MAG TPA: hemerythrin domain-containing protein [Coriobacteriia bacterium]|nr:hemerythrin domain-containing protein [Coriobacteriia bacterium]